MKVRVYSIDEVHKSEFSVQREQVTIRKPKLHERVASAFKRNGGFDTHKDDGTPIKKPSVYQRARSLLGKPRTDITDTGDDTPKLPKAKARFVVKKGTPDPIDINTPGKQQKYVGSNGMPRSMGDPATTAGAPDALRMKPKNQSYAPKEGVAGYEGTRAKPTGPRSTLKIDQAPASDMPKQQSTMKPPQPKMVAAKSETENQGEHMKELQELFKSEIGEVSDDDSPVITCPHCEEGISKSDMLAKSGKKTKNRPARRPVEDNEEGKIHRGPESGRNGATPTRTAHGVAKTSAGGKIVSKGSEVVDDIEDDVEDDNTETDVAKSEGEGKCPKCTSIVKAGTMCKCGHMMKSENPQAHIGTKLIMSSGTVFFTDSGEDAKIARMIETGEIGTAGRMTQPLDKNNSPRR